MPVTVTREMGITHKDFFRIFPMVAAGWAFRVNGRVITLTEAGRRLVIRLSEQSERRIAQLALPITRIEFEFDGFTEANRQEFMDRFDRSFRRGGG